MANADRKKVVINLHGENVTWSSFRALTTADGDRTAYINRLIEADRKNALKDPDTADHFRMFLLMTQHPSEG